MFPPSYSPVGWLSPLNSINFHFPNLISWIFSISLSPLALRIIPQDDIFQCCSQAIGEIITNSFCRQNMAFRRKGILFLQSCGWVLLSIYKINSKILFVGRCSDIITHIFRIQIKLKGWQKVFRSPALSSTIKIKNSILERVFITITLDSRLIINHFYDQKQDPVRAVG